MGNAACGKTLRHSQIFYGHVPHGDRQVRMQLLQNLSSTAMDCSYGATVAATPPSFLPSFRVPQLLQDMRADHKKRGVHHEVHESGTERLVCTPWALRHEAMHCIAVQ